MERSLVNTIIQGSSQKKIIKEGGWIKGYLWFF